jgi:hypothetical protein
MLEELWPFYLCGSRIGQPIHRGGPIEDRANTFKSYTADLTICFDFNRITSGNELASRY